MRNMIAIHPIVGRNIASENPLRELARMERAFERLFESFQPANVQSRTEGVHPISANVTEIEGRFEIQAALPGFGQEDVEVTLEKGVLKIQAGFHNEPVSETTESASETEESPKVETAHAKIWRRELLQGKFQRSFQLPEDLDPATLQAGMKNGMLTVSFRRLEPLQPETVRIPIAFDGSSN